MAWVCSEDGAAHPRAKLSLFLDRVPRSRSRTGVMAGERVLIRFALASHDI